VDVLVRTIIVQARAKLNSFKLCRAQPIISEANLVQARAKLNTFKLCRVQPIISEANRQASTILFIPQTNICFFAFFFVISQKRNKIRQIE